MFAYVTDEGHRSDRSVLLLKKLFKQCQLLMSLRSLKERKQTNKIEISWKKIIHSKWKIFFIVFLCVCRYNLASPYSVGMLEGN